MTDEPKPWRAEVPEAHAWMRGGVKCFAADVQALVTECNEELDKLRSELAEWKAKASPHCHDCREYQRACEVAGNHEALKDHVAQLREWADGYRLGGGMGSGLHVEKWPSLTPGARKALAEHVTWLEQALAELGAT